MLERSRGRELVLLSLESVAINAEEAIVLDEPAAARTNAASN